MRSSRIYGIILLILSSCFWSCQSEQKTKSEPELVVSTDTITKAVEVEKVVEPLPEKEQLPTVVEDTIPADTATFENPLYVELANEVLAVLAAGDYVGLSEYVDSTIGLLFSAYAFIDDPAILSPSEVRFESNADSVRLWGYYDGSGDSILMTYGEFYKSFVYSADFQGSAEVSVNEVGHFGNSLNNFQDIFPNGVFVDYVVKGTEKLGFMDWSTLRIGFVPKGKTWQLVALIHDEWTI